MIDEDGGQTMDMGQSYEEQKSYLRHEHFYKYLRKTTQAGRYLIDTISAQPELLGVLSFPLVITHQGIRLTINIEAENTNE